MEDCCSQLIPRISSIHPTPIEFMCWEMLLFSYITIHLIPIKCCCVAWDLATSNSICKCACKGSHLSLFLYKWNPWAAEVDLWGSLCQTLLMQIQKRNCSPLKSLRHWKFQDFQWKCKNSMKKEKFNWLYLETLSTYPNYSDYKQTSDRSLP